MGVLLIFGVIQNRLCSISRSIFTLTGKLPTPNKSYYFPINPYNPHHFTTLSSYRPPYRKIPTNPYHLSLPLHKNSTKNYPKIPHPSLSTQINSPNQSIPYNHPSSSTTIAPHSPHKNLNVFLA